MKLSTALAVLIAIQRHGHRMVCASASADDHERKLLINQADAAKKVNDAVGLAKASIDAGDVHGVALPMNYVALSTVEQFLTVALRLPGMDRDQHVMVDTGSPSLAFCNKSLAEEATDITKRDLAQCITYGFGNVPCPDDHSVTGDKQFYLGQVFQGNIAAYNPDTDEEIASMYDVNFAIMSKQQMGFCNGPLDGIIGVAYSALNHVVKIPSPEFDVLNLWNQSCESDDPFHKSIGRCSHGNMPTGAVPSPLEQSLKGGVDSGYDSVEAFGLYCDYAATMGSEKDKIISSLGAYFGGDVALNNTFYNSGTPQVATSPKCERANKVGWFTLKLNAITVPGLNNFSSSDFNQCNDQCKAKCFTDSGASSIYLPLPQSVCDNLVSLANTDPGAIETMGPLLLDLDGVNGSTITLSLPLLWLAEQKVKGYVICTGKTGRFVLGFPIYQYYYLVYDMGNNTVTFVDLRQSNETEAFIYVYGPELGGANESSTTKEPSTSSEPSIGSRHTGSPSTNTVVMAGLLLLARKYIF